MNCAEILRFFTTNRRLKIAQNFNLTEPRNDAPALRISCNRADQGRMQLGPCAERAAAHGLAQPGEVRLAPHSRCLRCERLLSAYERPSFREGVQVRL